MSDANACREADQAEAIAYAAMFEAAPTTLISAWGLHTENLDGATLLFAPGAPTPLFNRVIGFGTFDRASEASLDRIVRRYQEAGVTTFWLSVNEAAAPADIGEWLAARGFVTPPRRSWVQVRWTKPAAPVAQSRLDIAEARVPDAIAIAEVIRTAFAMPAPMDAWIAALVGRPGWQGYVAKDRGRVVGGGFVHTRASLGWLGMGAILPSHRGGGGQVALMAARIAHALHRGCTAVHTETGEPVGDEPNPSFLNMQRCGFERIASRRNFALSAVAG
jgi:GNAT superfamily N-acetyltransferase